MLQSAEKEYPFGEAEHKPTHPQNQGSSQYTPQEQKINQVLEELPSYILGKDRTPPKRVLFYQWAPICVGVSIFFLPIISTVVFLNENSSFGSRLSVFLLATTVISTATWLLGYFCDKKLKAPDTSSYSVGIRKQIITKAVSYMEDTPIRGRLAEMYLLSEHKDIDGKFWEKLEKELKSFNEQKSSVDPVKKQMEKISQSYRDQAGTL